MFGELTGACFMCGEPMSPTRSITSQPRLKALPGTPLTRKWEKQQTRLTWFRHDRGALLEVTMGFRATWRLPRPLTSLPHAARLNVDAPDVHRPPLNVSD